MDDEGEARVEAAGGGEDYDRLATLEKQYDSTSLLRMNQNIRPPLSAFAATGEKNPVPILTVRFDPQGASF